MSVAPAQWSDAVPDVRRGTVTIMIVDDEPKNRYALRQVLAELEANLVEVSSGEDALRFLLKEECAVILLDANMPGLDGYATAELIRRRDRSRHIPIIFVSAIDKSDEHVRHAYALGAVDYVFKPVDPVILRSKVSVLVDLYRKNAEAQRVAHLERLLLEENFRIRQETLEAERQLRQSEAQQSLILRSLPIAVYSCDLDSQLAGPRFVGDDIAQMLGFPGRQFADEPGLWPSRIHEEDRPRVLAGVAAIATEGVMSTEYRWRCADGTERFFLDQAVLVGDEADGARSIFGVCLDVTDRRQVEHQLHQSQKMDAVGQLTGGIAHDFNNMLTVVIGNLDALSRSLRDTGRNFDRAQMALIGALSCAELTQRLLAFARRQPLQPKVVNLGHICRNAARLLGRTLGEGVDIELALNDDLWLTMVDAAQVESSLINLAVNARDAMPNGAGQLRIEARNVHAERREDEVPPGDYVMLAVTDDGAGMTSEVLSRAVEPFFTTKKIGHGTGLGLSMVYGFAKQSGGYLQIYSAPGRGTSVRLYLPRAAGEVAADAAATLPDADDYTGQDRTVLLVEDDAGVRAVTAALLRDRHFQVIEADNAARALEIIDREPGIELLFTDVVMPGGMDGFQLGKIARERRPGLPVLYATGYAASFSATERHADVLAKPYREKDLLVKLRALLPQAASEPGTAPPVGPA